MEPQGIFQGVQGVLEGKCRGRSALVCSVCTVDISTGGDLDLWLLSPDVLS